MTADAVRRRRAFDGETIPSHYPGTSPGRWAEAAACRGLAPAHDARLPSEERDAERFTARVTAARARCSSCPVLDACAAWAARQPRRALSGVVAGEYYRGTVTPRRRAA